MAHHYHSPEFAKLRKGDGFGEFTLRLDLAERLDSGYQLEFDTYVSINDNSQGQSHFENSPKNHQERHRTFLGALRIP